MTSTFGGIEISKRSLALHQAALNTTGHNISNADSPSYARQRVESVSMDPLYAPSMNRAAGPGQLGQGSRVSNIQRIRDSFYDDQIVTTENAKSYWDVRNSYLVQMEHILNEPSDINLRNLHDKFWSSWQELANFPTERAHREVVLERAQALVSGIRQSHEKFQSLQNHADLELVTDIDSLNSLATEIRDLNERILKLQALGDSPNDLMDRRDHAIEKLSMLVDIRVGRGDKDELIVFIGEQALVQGEIQRTLVARPDTVKNGLHRVYWSHNDREVDLSQGRIYGLLEMRDLSIQERVDAMNTYALNLADTVNQAHRDGFALNGSTNQDFFKLSLLSPSALSTTLSEANLADSDLDRDGVNEATAVFRITGTNSLFADQLLGISGVLTLGNTDSQNSLSRINYNQNDTLNEVVKRINDRKTGLVAYIDHNQKLVLKAAPSEPTQQSIPRVQNVLRHIEDSGDLLVGYSGILNNSGEEGAYDYQRIGELSKLRPSFENLTLAPLSNPAAYLRVADEIVRDPASIVAAQGRDIGGIGDANTSNGNHDGSQALAIAALLKQKSSMVGHFSNAEEFHAHLIARLGTESRTARDTLERYRDDLVELNSLRQSVMGVNLDEEMSNMIQFQHAYNASARMLQTQSELLDYIIMRMGA